MANEPEVIRQQMEETRSGLQDKLETLEQQVKNTVQDATDAVSDTVETVKDSVKETVETVKETVQDTVQSVKETFNLSRHVQEHPWPAFACAALTGFIGTRLLVRWTPRQEMAALPYSSPPPGVYSTPPPPVASEPSSPPAKQRSWWSWLTDHYGQELDKLKGLAVATAGGILREMLTENLQPEFGERLKEVIDGFTVKLGGEPIQGRILTPAASEEPPPAKKEWKPEDYTPKTERFMGSGSR
jgi:ElaB/YqjD/DUF883 family membrane-anchored ribosome-binding protein